MMLEIAQNYALRGWLVFPLHTPTGNTAKPCSCNKPDCASVGKHPRTLNGLKDATNDPEAITRWWTMWPDANVGLATGETLGAIVLDVDPKHGGIETLKAEVKKHGFLSERVVVKTGSGGFHYFFAHPGGRIGNTQGTKERPSFLGAGLDLRADGGYVVAAGSLHSSGNRYEWEIERNGHWPELPDWLRKKITERQPVALALEVGDDEHLSAGARHPQLLRWAAQMRHHALSSEAILAALRIENEARCNPPKDDVELVKIARWFGAKTPGEALEAVGAEIVSDDVQAALKSVGDYEVELDQLYERGFQKGLHPGWDSVAEIFTIEPGHPTLVTGCPTAGKSSFVNAWLAHMALAYNWKAVFCSPEFHPIEYHVLRYIETYTGESAHGSSHTGKMRRDVYEAGKAWAKDHMHFVEPANARKRAVKLAMECALERQARAGCNALVLDPWASFVHEKKNGDRADEALASQLNELVEFGLKNKITPIIVAHPHMMAPNAEGKYPVVKPYDLNGGAMWFNLFYNILSLHRDPSWANGEVELYVWKIKYHWLGKVGSRRLYYKATTGRYSEQERGETRPWYQQRSEVPEF
jgi:hypothetical protein